MDGAKGAGIFQNLALSLTSPGSPTLPSYFNEPAPRSTKHIEVSVLLCLVSVRKSISHVVDIVPALRYAELAYENKLSGSSSALK